MNGAEVLLRTLLSAGIDTCFMNPGTSEMQFVAALDRVPGMRGILCLFEGVCSGAADGYARMLGRPASTLLHLGPGLANALANFHNARKARSPILSIVGEHSTKHMQYDAPLTADIDTFARTVTRDVIVPEHPAGIAEAAVEAIRAACRPPGHIAHLIVPADYSWSEAGDEAGEPPAPQLRRSCSEATVRRVGDLLRHGPATSFVLGGSALTGQALDAAGRLAATFGVRVFANRNTGRTESGRGRFQPARIAYFPEPAQEMLAGTRHLVLVESAPPVSFFGYPDQPSYLAPEDARVHTLAAIDEDGGASLSALADLVRAEPAQVATALPAGLPEPHISLQADTIGAVLATLLPEHAIVSDEAISNAEPIGRHLLTAAAHDLLPVTGGSIGQGLPVAVGAAVACPDRKVIAVEADGSAMYTLQSLWTMAREGLDVVAVILNNRRYRILDVEMKRTGANGFGPVAENMIDIGRPDLDFCKLSEAMGVEASRAVTCGEFADQLSSALARRGPRLIELSI